MLLLCLVFSIHHSMLYTTHFISLELGYFVDKLSRVHKIGMDLISDGSGPKPGPGPARSPGFLESPRPDIGRRAQARARPEPVVKSPGAQRALGI